MTSPLLEISGVSKRFGSFQALREVSLGAVEGELHAIIGPNGAGKTTLFNILTGQLAPSSGSVSLRGAVIHHKPAHRRVKLGLARCFQVTQLFNGLSVYENVRLAAQGRNSRRALNFLTTVDTHDAAADRARAVLERVGLEQVRDRLASELSHGQQRLLEVAMAMAPEPAVLLLDEPTSGMGVNDVPVMEGLLTELKGAYTVVMIEHNMGLTMRVADTITVLLGGEVVVSGGVETIRNDPRVRDAYLGQGGHA